MALDRLMPSINASRPGMDHTSPSDRSIPYIHAAFRRLTLAVHPSDQGMFALAVGGDGADGLSGGEGTDCPLSRSIARLGRQISFLTSQRLPRPDPTGAIARVVVDRLLDSIASSHRSHRNATGTA